MTALKVHTRARETAPRYARLGDQILVMATHYDPAHYVTPVRSPELAGFVGDPVRPVCVWWTVTQSPALIDPVLIRDKREPSTGEITGHMLIIAPDGGDPVELFCADGETIVTRESIEVDPWDGEREACGRRLPGGRCYIPAGHGGDCDPDVEITNGADWEPAAAVVAA